MLESLSQRDRLRLVEYYDAGELRYAGRVGSGFHSATLEALMEPLSFLNTDESPFANDCELARLGARWVTPKIVSTVKFAEWTDQDRIRAPVFIGIRTDVEPQTVHRG